MSEKVNIFWFRRDLRLEDNTALRAALNSGLPVIPLFIFDKNITEDLNLGDSRISFIYDTLVRLNNKIEQEGSCILIKSGTPAGVWKELTSSFNIGSVFYNKDYEPYAINRDVEVNEFLRKKGIESYGFKDQVIFEEKEILKPDGLPYTMFTPYKKAWLRKFTASFSVHDRSLATGRFFRCKFRFPTLRQLGFKTSGQKIKPYDLSCIKDYDKYRDFPAMDRTTYLGPHLRFGTVSIRDIVEKASVLNQVFLGELIWREFFMQILFNFPHVETSNFRPKYNNVSWRNNEKEFIRWCNGETGYPIVDAGMRQLNETGYMHNRVRMITSGFLCKHLLTAWWFGEAYFAGKLNDYELSSNNGNWQWVAGTGCDAAQYFRVFNPSFQQKKFDPHNEYMKRWVPEFNKSSYSKPMVEHEFARQRAIDAYRSGIL